MGVYDLANPDETLIEIHVPNAKKDKHVRRAIAEATKVLGLISSDGGDSGAARKNGAS